MATAARINSQAIVKELIDEAIDQATSFDFDPDNRIDFATDKRFSDLVDEIYRAQYGPNDLPDDVAAMRETAAAHAGFNLGLELGRRLAGWAR